MQLTLLIPELIWPETGDGVLERIDCPALSTLLARSRRRARAPQSLETTLADAFGRASPAPYAAFRLLGEPRAGDAAADLPAVGDDCWLCCDPVHLRAHQHQILLADSGGFTLGIDEARALVAELNRELHELGRFHVATAGRWYLRLADRALAEGFETRPLSLVAGRRVEQLLPETAAARALRSRLNEAQMLLHAHPLNQQREDSGQMPINSLWLWGAGALPARVDSRFDGVWAATPLALGLARAAGVPAHRRPIDAATLLEQAAPDTAHLVVLDDLLAAVQYENGVAYCDALDALERQWIAPLRAALARGAIARLRIDAPTAYATLSWESTRRQQWALWRRRQSLAALAGALAAKR